MRGRAVALAVVGALACASSEGTGPGPGPVATGGGVLACGGVGGTIRARDVTLPERGTGRTLAARVFAPDAARQTAPCPLVSVLPGGGADIASVEWAAMRLAANGYVVVVTLPSSGASTAAYDAAARSGIDFLLSTASPFASQTDTTAIGVAGWSLGARALSITQEQDARVDALVAWDNLAVSETGDDGSPLCTNAPGTPRVPRVPAMGQASDGCQKGADAKKTAYERWRAARVPTMEVVFAGASHFLWSAQSAASAHDLSHHYTQAWLDRWLKRDTTATTRLLARTVGTRTLASLLSTSYRSAAYLDGRDCADLRAGC